MAKTIKVYHGTNQAFKVFDQGKARIANDFYGGGVAYFTDTLPIAEGYAQAMFKKGIEKRMPNNKELIYVVDLKISKLFDVDHTYTGKELTQFYKRSEQEQFARGAGLLVYGVDKYDVLNQLDEGTITLTGDQIFKGLSRGMISTAAARSKLISLGFDTLRYNGGIVTGSPKHNVYITYKAANAKIHEECVARKPYYTAFTKTPHRGIFD